MLTLISNSALYLAAFLLVAIGIAHSYLGERYILIRLFRRDDLPKLFGSPEFTKRTLRFAWHLTSIAWWGFAAILVSLTERPPSYAALGTITGTVFLFHGAVALIGSRGKHMSWPIFLAIGVLSIVATRM